MPDTARTPPPTWLGNGKQKRDPRGHVKRDPPVSVNSSVHDLLPWRLFRGCSDLADGLTLAVHIVTCALRSHSVRLSETLPEPQSGAQGASVCRRSRRRPKPAAVGGLRLYRTGSRRSPLCARMGADVVSGCERGAPEGASPQRIVVRARSGLINAFAPFRRPSPPGSASRPPACSWSPWFETPSSGG